MGTYGYILGLRSKVNPLIVYYNKDTFHQLGLESPSVDWNWNTLDVVQRSARIYPEYRGGRMKSKYLVLFLLLSFLFTACETDKDDYGILLEDEGLKNTLSIELVEHDSNGLLYQKIMSFAEKHTDLEVNVSSHTYAGVDLSTPWILGGEKQGDPPDILELTPNQMKMFFHHGKLESLALQEPQYQDYFIHSPDGYVLGVKTKINPLVVYYNRDIFRQHGLELPTDGWDTVIQTHQAGAKGSQLNEGSEEWSVLIQEVRRSVPVSLMMNEGSQWTNHWSKSPVI